MTRALRFCMVGLVLVNLAFVQITEAASWTWLMPLFLLTVGAPWLIKLTRFFAYRALWNVSVLGAFGLLVHHVTDAGVEHLLEDGLLLAALCQVHLLNNLGRLQKPDLLFFNSFLIAVVTSYLSLDLGYSLVFLAYAPLFVVSLQLLTLTRAGTPTDDPALVGRMIWSGFGRGLFVLGLTLVVFFFLPRDFERKGLLGEQLKFRPPGAMSEVGFAEKIDLNRSGKVLSSDRVVAKAELVRGVPATVPVHWRGATLDRFDGKRWKYAHGGPLTAWRCQGRDLVQGDRDVVARVDVMLRDVSAGRFFAPLAAQRFSPGLREDVRAQPLSDGNLRCVFTTRERGKLHYSLELHNGWRDRGGRIAPMTRANRRHIYVRYSAVPDRARKLGRRLRREFPNDAEQHQIVERMRAFLATQYEYLLPGAAGGAGDLDEFLSGAAGAHCEYFATALVLMLRSVRIPCRIVTGYRSDEWNEDGTELTVRARHAHAWVEVLDPKAGWYTVDATPATGSGAATAKGLWAQLRVRATNFWARITGFDESARGGALGWLTALPGRAKDWFVSRPGDGALLLAGFVLLVLAARWGRRRRWPPAVRGYRAAVRAVGLPPENGETPREFLARARAEVAPERWQRLEAATIAHEQARYSRS